MHEMINDCRYKAKGKALDYIRSPIIFVTDQTFYKRLNQEQTDSVKQEHSQILL
ncbi:MAG: hypothetical protein IJ159_01760 [Prevotella sp.]|nr:hypothetical protein [Prevotella sp.]